MELIKIKPLEYNEQLLYSMKVSEVLPFLKHIANEHNLNLVRHTSKAMKILLKSINEN